MQHNVGRRAGSDEMRDDLKSVGKGVLAGQDREHARHGTRRRRIDPADQGVAWGERSAAP